MKIPGVSLRGWDKRYGNKQACVQARAKVRWPDCFLGPRCGSKKASHITTQKSYQCFQCRHQVSDPADTLFHSTNLSLVQNSTPWPLKIKRTLFLLLALLILLPGFNPAITATGPKSLWAADENNEYPDTLGQEALRLWAERERDREIAEASRRYWDYWLSKPSRYHSAHRLWFELEQMQKWLQDPKHHEPPPPPPFYWSPPPWYPPPHFYPYYRRHYRERE